MSNVYHEDPWATESQDTGPEDPWASPGEPGYGDKPIGTTDEIAHISEKKETKTVTATEDPIVLTFKQSGGYDAPWVVLRANTIDEAKGLIKDAVGGGLFDAVKWASKEFAGKDQAAGTARPQPSAPAPQQPAPQGGQPTWADGRSCSHGVMVAREGTNKFGKPYKAYFCAAPKGTQDACRAVFL